MLIEDITRRTEELAREICQKIGADLVQMKASGPLNSFHIQVTANKPGGITIRECSIIHKALIAAIIRETLLTPGTFSMEVSSPGIQ